MNNYERALRLYNGKIVEAEKQADKIINNNGYCIFCKTKNIHYGIENGNYTYYCLKCDKKLNKTQILINL